MKIITKTKSDWTLENISDFWDYISSKTYLQKTYFTSMVGKGIMNFISKKIELKGNFLDYGCGMGQFLELISKEEKLNLYGLDYSLNSVQEVNKKLNSANWKGAVLLRNFPSTYQSNYFDIVTFIETIEHLQDEVLIETINEIKRVLKKGGKVIVTTPFDEKLEENNTFCPFCKSEFHHMQHMQSFSKESISKLFISQGFNIEFCDNLNFQSYISTKAKIKYYITKTFLNRPNNNKPHLVLIASKI